MQSVVLVETGQRSATGLVIADGRHVLTTASLVRDRTLATVRHENGSSVTATVLASDASRDLAVLSLRTGQFSPADLTFSGVPAIGENVGVAGYSQALIGFPTLTRGIVTSIRVDTDEGVRFIETDVPVFEGNTGSPLTSYHGELCGFVVNKTPLLRGDPVPGHAYALTMDDVRDVLEALGIRLG